jgi:hypothetical protein
MKGIVYLTCIGILAFALTAWGLQEIKQGTGQREVGVRAARTPSHPEPAEAIRLLE